MTADPKDFPALFDQLVETLEFYSDPQSYHAISFLFDPPCGEFSDDFGTQDEHGHYCYSRPMPGKRARAALSDLRAIKARIVDGWVSLNKNSGRIVDFREGREEPVSYDTERFKNTPCMVLLYEEENHY